MREEQQQQQDTAEHCSRKINGGTDENLIFLTFKITHRQDTEGASKKRDKRAPTEEKVGELCLLILARQGSSRVGRVPAEQKDNCGTAGEVVISGEHLRTQKVSEQTSLQQEAQSRLLSAVEEGSPSLQRSGSQHTRRRYGSLAADSLSR